MPKEFIEGNNRLSADIVDRAGNKIGPGPLLSCLDFNCDLVLSQAGQFSARFPANDPRLAWLQLKRHFLDFYFDGELIYYGLAESQSLEVGNDGQQTLVVSGRDAMAELAETSIDFTEIKDDSDPVFNAHVLVLIAYNSLGTGEQWVNDGLAATVTPVYGSFAGETALTALTKIAEHIGESFRLTVRDGFRHVIEWLGASAADSGVRAVQGAGDAIDAENNPHICFIQRLTERRDASRMITKLYPYGAGLGETRLDLLGTDRMAPAGFVLNEAENSLTSTAALAYIGKTIARHVNFKDIRPLFNTDADIQSAKNYLFDAALAYLKRNDSIDDVVEYDLDVVQLPSHVRVGMSLRVVYQDFRYDLDTDLVILAIGRSIGSDGSVNYKLTVAPTNQWRLRETSALVAQMEEGEIFAGHPQIDACSYWENFREEIGDDQTNHIAQMPFVLAEEVVTIRQVLFRYKVDRVLVGTKSYAYVTPATDQNATSVTGGSNTTATAGTNTAATDGVSTPATSGTNTASTDGVSTPATADTNTAASGVTAPGSTDSDGGGLATSSAAPGSTDSDGGGLATSGVAAGTTDATILPDAFTDNSAGGITIDIGFNTGFEQTTDVVPTGQDTGTNSAVGDPHTHEMPHSHLLSHIHDDSLLPTHSHGMAHTHSIGTTHGHATPAHTHAHAATHAHATPAHSHAHATTHSHTIAHTHNMPHSHTMPHTHNMPHTHTMPHTHDMPHDHASPQHTHDAPALVESFALLRIPALNSYVLAELEYSVNGGSWLGLEAGIPVAGGYFQIDVTSGVQNPSNLRPLQEDNLIQVRRKVSAGAGKTAQIRVKLGVRSTIQSIAIFN